MRQHLDDGAPHRGFATPFSLFPVVLLTDGRRNYTGHVPNTTDDVARHQKGPNLLVLVPVLVLCARADCILMVVVARPGAADCWGEESTPSRSSLNAGIRYKPCLRMKSGETVSRGTVQRSLVAAVHVKMKTAAPSATHATRLPSWTDTDEVEDVGSCSAISRESAIVGTTGSPVTKVSQVR